MCIEKEDERTNEMRIKREMEEGTRLEREGGRRDVGRFLINRLYLGFHFIVAVSDKNRSNILKY